MLKLIDLMKRGVEPRVHGNGFIQVDINDDARLHIWGHPRVPRQKIETNIHDHRFDFYSRVIVGRLVNVTYSVAQAGPRYHTHTAWVRRVRAGEDTVLAPDEIPNRILTQRGAELVEQGAGYFMPAKMAHETLTDRPSATVMVKGTSFKEYEVQVYAKRGEQPDNDFHRHEVLSPVDAWKIVTEVVSPETILL